MSGKRYLVTSEQLHQIALCDGKELTWSMLSAGGISLGIGCVVLMYTVSSWFAPALFPAAYLVGWSRSAAERWRRKRQRILDQVRVQIQEKP